MRSLFSTALKFSAISALALCNFVACSDDSSSNASSDTPQQSSTPVVGPQQSTLLSPITIGQYTTEISPDGSYLNVAGSASLNLMDSAAIPAGVEVYFTNFEFILAKVENGIPMQTQLQITCNGSPCRLEKPAQVVNLTQISTTISNFGENDCGTFRIYSTYYASYDANQPNMFIKTDSSDFTRPQSYCQVQQPVIPQQAIVPGENVILTSYTVALNTKSGDGLSLSTGTVVPQAQADIYFTSDELTDEIKVHSSNGFQLTDYTNADDMNNFDDDWSKDLLPPEPAHMSDFRFRKNKLSTSADFTSYVFYIALGANYNEETGDGFYTFTELDHTVADANHNIVVTLLVYKK